MLKPGTYFVQGNEAIAEGAIAAGCRYYAGYPITPVSEVSEILAERLPKVGGIVMQFEDEIASVHSVAGAVVAGLKAMTASSGPGISLKLEGLGYGLKNELPYVVVDVQRAGPSNGVATRVGQADLYTVRYGSAGGNSAIIALSPKSVQEAYELTIEAFNLAEIFRNPVFLLTDEGVGHMREKLVIPEPSELKIVERKKPTVPPEEFVMYPLDDEAVINYPLPALADGYGMCVSPYTHTSKGYATTAMKDQHKMANRLVKKITKNLDLLTRVEKHYLDDPELEYCVVAYGSNARPALSAVRKARAEGIKIGLLRPIIVWPFPDKEILAVAEKVKSFIVPEVNLDGQLSREVARAAKGKAEVFHLGHAGVEIHTVAEVYEEIRRVVNEY